MIVVVEGPSAAGKTTWCDRHTTDWLPEPGRWPIDEVLRYQAERWRLAVDRDAAGDVVVLDGDPFKLYYRWAERQVGVVDEAAWEGAAETTRRQFAAGDLGLADLVLYADPGEDELRRRRDGDPTRSRRNFERNTSLRTFFRRWYEAVGRLDPQRVVWGHPVDGLSADLLALGPRPSRSDPELLDRLLSDLATEA